MKEFKIWIDKAIIQIEKLRDGAIGEEKIRLNGKLDGLKLAKGHYYQDMSEYVSSSNVDEI